MPDILDQIRADEATIERQSLETARTENRWASTFNSIPPVEALRASRNLTAQVNAAVERRQKLAAETDANAQQIYLRQKAFDAEMELQPLKVRQMESQIAATQAREQSTSIKSEAFERITRAKEEASAGFAAQVNGMLDRGVKPWQPEFAEGLLKARSEFPASHQDFVDYWKSTNLSVSPDDVYEQFLEARKKDPNAGVSINPKGQLSFRVNPVPVITPYQEESLALRKERMDQIKKKEEDTGKKDSWNALGRDLRSFNKEASPGDFALEWKANPDGSMFVERPDGGFTTLPRPVYDQFVGRFKALTPSATPAEVATPEGVPSAPPEQRVRQKSTGRMGVIRYGQFIPDAT